MNKIKIDDQKMDNLLRDMFREKAEKELRLEKIKSIMKANRMKKVRRRLITLGIPITIAALLILWISVIQPIRAFEPDEYYDLHFKTEIREINYRDINGSQNPDRTVNTAGDLKEKIILGKQAMSEENWQEADEIFKQLKNLGGSVQIESLWHLSLIQLKTDNLPQCKTYLKELIATKDPSYLKQARKLLRML